MKLFNWRDTKWGAYTFAVCCGVILYVLLEHLCVVGDIFVGIFSFLEPVLLGVVLAYIMDPLARLYERYLSKIISREVSCRTISVALTALSILLVIGLILFNLIPQLIDSIQEFSSNISKYESGLQSVFGNINIKLGEIQIDSSNFTKTMNSMISVATKHLSENMGSVFDILKNIGNGGTSMLIAFIIAIYCLMDKKNLLKLFYRLFSTLIPERYFRNAMKIYDKTNTILSKYIVCTLLDALFVGIINAVFMLIAGMPYISLVSTVVGITNMAPTFGPIVGAAIGAFILLLSHPWYALVFLIFTLVLQVIDGYIVKPKFYGNALSVPSIWILISIVVFGRMFGIIGILLAIPFAALITYLLGEIFKYLDSKKAGAHHEKQR